MLSFYYVTFAVGVLAGFVTICQGNVGDSELFCVVSPPVLDSDSSTPVTLTAVVSGTVDEGAGYSITFSSRDDPELVTDSHRVTFGKIGTQKGEKGDKGDRPAVVTCPGDLTGLPGEDGANGASAQGPPGPTGPSGPEGDPGVAGSDNTDLPSLGANEQYCMGELPECISTIETRQCVKGQKGAKGALGATCTPGRQGEKGEPPKPDLVGPPGDVGPGSTVPGPQGPPGEDAPPSEMGYDAPQPNCDLDTNDDLATIRVSYGGDKGDTGEIGDPATEGAKGAKGQPGVPGTPGGTVGAPGIQGPAGSPGPAGPPGPAGTSTGVGVPGLRIRPRYLGPNPEPQCISNAQVAAKTLKLHKPADRYKKDTRFGVFSCDLTTPSFENHVPVLLNNQQELFPADAKRTHIVSVLDSMQLCVDDSVPKNCITQLEWVHNGEKTSQLKKFSGFRCMRINRVTPEHAGIYEAYRRPIGRNAKKHAYFLVIVRECPDGFYDNRCNRECQSSCVQGYCDAVTGGCICMHGFYDTDCAKALGEGNIGHGNGNEISCLDLGYGRSCEGILVCSEAAGCTCASGWKGPKCDQACELGTYGPDCCFTCPAEIPECNRFTGEQCEEVLMLL